jgi:uncharacterized phiE125 gp8 family phage protein
MGSYDLVTLAQVKEHLEIVNADQDSYLSTLIERVTGLVEGSTRRKLKSRTYTDELYDGSGTAVLRLKEWPVTSITAISFLDSQTSTTWTSQSLTYAVIDKETERSIVFRDGTPFPRGFQNVKLTFVAGYSTVPAELASETLRFLTLLHRLKDKQLEYVESISALGQTTRFVNPVRFLEDSPIFGLNGLYSRRDF